MNMPSFKEFIRTPKGKLCVALGCMFISWIFLFLNFSSSLDLALPDARKKAKLQSDIRKLRSELRDAQESLRKNKELKDQFKDMIRTCWIPARDGAVELGLRQVIESAAKKNELKLNTLGTVRTSRINSDLSYAELDINTHAPLETIAKFISTIQDNKPAISWKRLTVYSIIRRHRHRNNQSRTVSGSNSENNLIFSASFRVIVYEKEIDLTVKTPAENKPSSPGRQISKNSEKGLIRSGKGGKK